MKFYPKKNTIKTFARCLGLLEGRNEGGDFFEKPIFFPIFVSFQVKYLVSLNEMLIILLLMLPNVLTWNFCVLALFQL